MKTKIIEILNQAVNAPSGDNSQPWRFRIKDNKLEVFLIPGLDETPYNFMEFGSYLANGALVENIIILASSYNLKTNIELMPESEEPNKIANIFFEESISTPDLLADYIEGRHTNRKPYRLEKINNTDKKTILTARDKFPSVRLAIIDNLPCNENFIQALSLNDELIFSNKRLHQCLFKIINWTEEEETEKKRGLFVKTMELNREQIMAFRKLRSWHLMETLKKLHIPKLISATNKKLYQATPVFGALLIDELTPMNFIECGRAVERIWLTASHLQYNFHPVSGIPYLALRLRHGDLTYFNAVEIDEIKKADLKISQTFKVADGMVAFLFRLGVAQPATAKSRKSKPVFF